MVGPWAHDLPAWVRIPLGWGTFLKPYTSSLKIASVYWFPFAKWYWPISLMFSWEEFKPASTFELNALDSMLVPQDCCNKVPQTGWLKTMDIYSLEARSFKSKYQQAMFPQKALGRNSYAALLASGGPWVGSVSLHPHLCLLLHVASSCVSSGFCI